MQRWHEDSAKGGGDFKKQSKQYETGVCLLSINTGSVSASLRERHS